MGQGPDALENETPGAQDIYKQRRRVNWLVHSAVEVMADAYIKTMGWKK